MPVSISVIIPTHNMARFLPDAINSVLKNTFKDVELIIADDGSTDNTRQVVTQFTGASKKEEIPIHYHSQSHRGKSACLNEVLTTSLFKGRHIVFVDADDVLPVDSLQKRYEAIQSSEAGLVIGEFTVTDIQGKEVETRRLNRKVDAQTLLHQFFFGVKTPFHLNSTIISAHLLSQIGLFDESLVRGQETDYSIRLLKIAQQIAILPEVVYQYRKYSRPTALRLKIRLQTMYYRHKMLAKYLQGVSRFKATAWHTLLDSLKLGYELVRKYEKR